MRVVVRSLGWVAGIMLEGDVGESRWTEQEQVIVLLPLTPKNERMISGFGSVVNATRDRLFGVESGGGNQ